MASPPLPTSCWPLGQLQGLSISVLTPYLLEGAFFRPTNLVKCVLTCEKEKISSILQGSQGSEQESDLPKVTEPLSAAWGREPRSGWPVQCSPATPQGLQQTSAQPS